MSLIDAELDEIHSDPHIQKKRLDLAQEFGRAIEKIKAASRNLGQQMDCRLFEEHMGQIQELLSRMGDAEIESVLGASTKMKEQEGI